MEHIQGKRIRKKTNLDFFSPGHQVRADGTRKGPDAVVKSNGIVVQVFKPTLDIDPGVSLKDATVAGTKVVQVSSIAQTSIFKDTDLTVGMKVCKINGIQCTRAKFAHALLESAEGTIKVNAKPGKRMCHAAESSVAVASTQTPPRNRTQAAEIQTPFRTFINVGDNAPAAVKQNRGRFKKTPKGKRKNDLKLTFQHGLDRLTENMLPRKSPDSRRRMTKDFAFQYYDKERG